MNNAIDKELVSRCCWQLLITASLLLLAFPSAFATSQLFGQTWLWLTAIPICVLFVVHRHRLAAAWSTALVNSPSRRRRQTLPGQARRKGFGNKIQRRNPSRAA